MSCEKHFVEVFALYEFRMWRCLAVNDVLIQPERCECLAVVCELYACVFGRPGIGLTLFRGVEAYPQAPCFLDKRIKAWAVGFEKSVEQRVVSCQQAVWPVPIASVIHVAIALPHGFCCLLEAASFGVEYAYKLTVCRHFRPVGTSIQKHR